MSVLRVGRYRVCFGSRSIPPMRPWLYVPIGCVLFAEPFFVCGMVEFQ